MSGCCVYGCSNRYSTKGFKFYRIPTGSRPFQRNRRRLWLQAIKRVDWSEDVIKNARVCSAHFISGEVSLDFSSPDFVPSVFVYTKPRQNPETKLERYHRKRRRDDRPTTAANLCVPSETLTQECSTDHCPATDVQQLLFPQKEQQQDPQPPHIKEEPEDQELPHIKEEQFQVLEKADSKVLCTSDIKEEAQSSHLNQRQTEQMETEEDGEDSRGPEPDRNSGTTEDSSETETDDSDDWNETSGPQSGLYSHNNDEASVGDLRCRTSEKPLICSECKKTFGCVKKLKRHMMTHISETPFSCSQCGKCFTQKESLKRHMRWHAGEKPFNCLECGKHFTEIGEIECASSDLQSAA